MNMIIYIFFLFDYVLGLEQSKESVGFTCLFNFFQKKNVGLKDSSRSFGLKNVFDRKKFLDGTFQKLLYNFPSSFLNCKQTTF